jgi:histidine triad (HIT) family protein
MMIFAKKVAKAIEQVVPCKRIGITVIGMEVPHAHIHLIPLNNLHDMEFSKPKLKLSQEEFIELSARISKLVIF